MAKETLSPKVKRAGRHPKRGLQPGDTKVIRHKRRAPATLGMSDLTRDPHVGATKRARRLRALNKQATTTVTPPAPVIKQAGDANRFGSEMLDKLVLLLVSTAPSTDDALKWVTVTYVTTFTELSDPNWRSRHDIASKKALETLSGQSDRLVSFARRRLDDTFFGTLKSINAA